MDLETLLRDLATFCAARQVPAWLVGGAARDIALGRTPVDLDLAVDGDGLALARAFADAIGGAFVPLDDDRLTGRAVIPGPSPLVVDIAALRAPTIEDDLRLRDFTLNALAIPLVTESREQRTENREQRTENREQRTENREQRTENREQRAESGAFSLQPSAFSLQPSAFLDPTGGLADLRAGVLRAAGPTSLGDDPLRVLRAGRLMAVFGLRLDPELPAAMAAAAPGLARVAAERSRDELLKLLDAPAAAPALRALDACGALTSLIPELAPCKSYGPRNMVYTTIMEHLLETVAGLDWLVACVKGVQPGGRALRPDELPAAVGAHPELANRLPYAERLGALLAERRAGGHSRGALLKLAALLHDIAKPQTARDEPDGKVSFFGHQDIGAETASAILRRLKVSRADTAYVCAVIREHMRPGQLRTNEVITLRAVARFFRDLGDAGPDVLLHELADHLATREHTTTTDGWAAHLAFVEAMLAHHYEPPPERVAPLIDGHGLMAELGLAPGRLVGTLLREIAEAQAAGEITTRDEALARARERMKDEG